jgi:RNA polymerase sigma-70 factor (ECF subfamily)
MSSPGRRPEILFLPGAAGDHALATRLRAGDERAYEELYNLHAPKLFRLLRRLVGSGPIAEDVVQETFAAAFRAVGRFRGEASLATWITGIGIRHALNALRGQARRLRSECLAEAETVCDATESWLAGRSVARTVLGILDKIEPEKRSALLLHAEGYTATEIAGIMGAPRGTVLSRLARGRAELIEFAVRAGIVPNKASAEEGGV